jgi:hypothetical protein
MKCAPATGPVGVFTKNRTTLLRALVFAFYDYKTQFDFVRF